VRTRIALSLWLLALVLSPRSAGAEERTFVDVYTTAFDEAGESELALHSGADHGQRGVKGSDWSNRLEIEHTFSARFTGALYLNYLQSRSLAGSPRFDGPSLEAIWKPARPRAGGLETALYLEARATANEVELEPRVILARASGRTRLALNAVGEFEFKGENESGEEGEKLVALTGGASRGVGRRVSLGVEGRLDQFVTAGVRDPRALFLGPTLGVSAAGLRLTMAWQPQIAGAPASSGQAIEVADFPRARYRVVLGADL